MNISKRAKWALGTATALIVLLIACGGSSIRTCEDERQRCEDYCDSLGWEASINTCAMQVGGFPMGTCTCAPLPSGPDESQAQTWEDY